MKRPISLSLLAAGLATQAVLASRLELTTATIADLNAAFANGALTAEDLLAMYLRRIEAYDQQGPSINTVITLNPQAVAIAKSLDTERKATGPRSPIHGIPVVLKDNIDTFDLPTTGGSMLLKGSIPPDDAFVVKKLREAGAIILAKVNLNEFADRGYAPHGFSSLGGQTRNPHDPSKNPAGSSGGTGAAIAAAFAQFGLGTDTGGSIRMPSSVNGIVGLRPTHDLLSRDGIVPISHSFDTAGPMARSVYDVAVSLGLMTGVAADDDATKTSAGKFETDDTGFLQCGALKGARIGVALGFVKGDGKADRDVEAAVAKLKEPGAVVVDPLNFPEHLLVASSAISLAVPRSEFTAYVAGYPATTARVLPKYTAPFPGVIISARSGGSWNRLHPFDAMAAFDLARVLQTRNSAVFRQQK